MKKLGLLLVGLILLVGMTSFVSAQIIQESEPVCGDGICEVGEAKSCGKTTCYSDETCIEEIVSCEYACSEDCGFPELVAAGEEFTLIESQTAIIENYNQIGDEFRVEYLGYDNGFYFDISSKGRAGSGIGLGIRIEGERPGLLLNIGESSPILGGLSLRVINYDDGSETGQAAKVLLIINCVKNDGSLEVCSPLDFTVSIDEEFRFDRLNQIARVSNIDNGEFQVKFVEANRNGFYFDIGYIGQDNCEVGGFFLDVGEFSPSFHGLSLRVVNGAISDEFVLLVIEHSDISDESLYSEGCTLDSRCYPIGYVRKTKTTGNRQQRILVKHGEYCSNDKIFKPQLELAASCENDFECVSDFCIDEECTTEPRLIKKIFNWFKRLFGG